MNRVVVTGMGAITPIGNDVESFWNGLKEKKVGIGPITYFDTAEYKAKLAAQVGAALAAGSLTLASAFIASVKPPCVLSTAAMMTMMPTSMMMP